MTKRRKKNDYWTKEQELAIEQYLTMDPESPEAERLFEGVIYDPLKKLVENIMFTYHLNIAEIPVIEQVYDTIGFVVSKMRKFDPSKGHKSFSYYGTVAKNYMIMKKNKHYNKKIHTVDIEDVIGFEYEQELFEDAMPEQELKSKEFLFSIVCDDLEEIIRNDLTLHQNVYKVAEAIVFLLRNYQRVNVYNKRQFYFIVREFTGLSAKEITRAMSQIKEVYERSRKSLH